MLRVEYLRSLSGPLSICNHIKNALHDVCRIWVYYQTMPVVGVFPIAKRSNRVDIHAALRQIFLCTAYLSGKIAAVQIVDQCTERRV